MPRWVFYDLFSGQGVLIQTQADEVREPALIYAAEKHARAYRNSRALSDGDRFRLQHIPDYDECPSQDFVYRAPRGPRMDECSP